MKTRITYPFVASCILLLALVLPVSAGTITITSGPTYTPDTAITNNTFVVQVAHDPPGVSGDQLQASGGATVTAPPENTFTAEISGTFTANAGDIPSVAYSVTIDANVSAPIAYTATANLMFLGVPQVFNGMGMILPGLHQYNDVWQSPVAFPLPGNGTWSGQITMTFASAASAAEGAQRTLGVHLDAFNIQLATSPVTAPPPSYALNLSTRLGVQSGENVLIGGFIVAGNLGQTILVRAIGPSLSSFFTGVLPDPAIQLYEGSNLIQSNDNWRSDQEQAITATGIAPTNDLESAILRDLQPGAYTAIVSGNGNTTGIGLVEAYDLGQGLNARLANISTRGFVDTGNNVMIGGFILGPNTGASSPVVIRGIGPSLSAVGVANPLPDPYLELHDGNGMLLSSNDNWMSDANSQTITDLGLAPANSNEAAIYAIPAPGNYTAILSSVNNTTGVGLVEVYHLTN